MEKAHKKDSLFPIIITALLFAVLIILTSILIQLFGNQRSAPPEALSLAAKISTYDEKDNYDISGYLVPEFIGITSEGKRLGITYEINVMSEIYNNLSPYLSEMSFGSSITEISDDEWISFAKAENSVYFRYHNEYPDVLVFSMTDYISSLTYSRDEVDVFIYEMLLIPSDEPERSPLLITRDFGGKSYLFTPTSIITESGELSADILSRLSSSFSSSMHEFKFSFEFSGYESASQTEPIILDALITRNVLMSDGSATTMRSSQTEITYLLKLFGMNPDKLLSTRLEDSVSTYTDRQGVLTIEDTYIDFKAAEDDIPDPVLNVSDIEGSTLIKYIKASAIIFSDFKNLGRIYAGGVADIGLVSVSSTGRTVRLVFDYFYDNIPIKGIDHALDISFTNGNLVSFRLYTMSVRNLGVRNEMFTEWWFYDMIKKKSHVPSNVTVVYRGNYQSDAVSAEWAAID